ncbi:putative Microcephalin [Nannochloris sp. 'desiccata']|nr:hypothetical protein KSW81_004860 [Chlorella desiccata (nom. nud.)]KAH7618169.1 putative Microcephalin [Chlorella desiccata (nom. nud.)]
MIVQLPCPPSIVSPLWVEESITQGRRLMEKRYMVARPKENLLAAAPNSTGARASGGGTKKRKQRSSGPAPPKPAGEFDLNLESDWLFDSSQQLKEPGTSGSDAADPLSGPRRHSRLRRTRSSARTSGKLAAAATAAVNDEPAAGLRVGSATQAVADILAIDLPADREWPENSDEDEDLDTPLSVRMARQSSGKRQKIGGSGSSVAVFTDGKAGAKAAAARGAKSRLAHSSKASDEKRIQVAVEEEKGEEAPVDDKEPEDKIDDDYDMDVDEALATQVEEKEKPAPKAKPTRKQTKKPKQEAPVAVRFSMRNLHPEKQMLVHKGTPLVPIKSVSTAKANGRAQVIPIPEAVRVNSPWNEPTPAATTAVTKARRPGSAAPLAFTRPRVSFGGFAVQNGTASKSGGGGGTANVSTPTLPTTLQKVVIRDKVPTPWSPRRWDGAGVEITNGVNVAGGCASGNASCGNKSTQQNAGKPSSQQRRSRFGTQNDEEESAAAAALAARALEEAENVATMPDAEEEDVIMMEVAGVNEEMPSFVPDSDDEEEEGEKKEQENASENVKKAPKNNNSALDGGANEKKNRRKTTTTRRTTKEETQIKKGEEKAKEAVKKVESSKQQEEGPKHGFIAVTSTTSGVVALCKSAVQRLRGLRFCAEGKEDGTITHLIIGDERRTMKAMLAVANGAILLDPEWITASLEAGKWVAEGPYKSKVRFAAAADRARERIASTSKAKQGLLAEHAIHIHPGQGNPAALKRVAMALGASITSLKDCSVCVVSGKNGEKPRGVPRKVPVVSEEWLLGAAETFKVPNVKKCTVTVR